MSTIKTAAAIASLVAAPLAQAATDPGLTLHGTHAYARHLGVGAQARIVVPLSGARKGGANAGRSSGHYNSHLVDLVHLIYLVCLVCLVYLVYLVHLVNFIQLNHTRQTE